MRKAFILIVCLVFGQFVIAQNIDSQTRLEHKVDSLVSLVDSLMNVQVELLEQLDIDLSLKDRYKMYLTENTYNLLELDTKTGIVKQVQWGLNDTYEGWWYINSTDLSYGASYGPGSFELYPTQNMYQFILIDQTDGRKWHIQWGIGDKQRWIRRIW